MPRVAAHRWLIYWAISEEREKNPATQLHMVVFILRGAAHRTKVQLNSKN